MDARAGHRDAVDADGTARLVQSRAVFRQCLAKFGDAEVVVVKSLAGVQRRLGRVADEGGRDLIAFAEPELQDVAAGQAGIGTSRMREAASSLIVVLVIR
jgi:hypothetical protein